jgi:hypothetical protein
MNQHELDTLSALQKLVAAGILLTVPQQLELDRLRTKMSVTEMERADNPDTLLVDETRSPNLSDDGDYKRQQIARDVKETVADVKEGVGFLAWLLGLFGFGRR